MALNFLGFMLYAQPIWYHSSDIEKHTSSNVKTARILAEVYLLSDPRNDPNELIRYIQDKPKYFTENGTVTVAARDLGNWILSNKMEAFEGDCLEKIKKQFEREEFSREYASDLLAEIKEGKIDCSTIAKELLWLSDILPDLSEGNIKAYVSSDAMIRQQLRIAAPVYNAMHNSDPEIRELILKDNNCYYKKMADQVQLLSLISITN
jgi:hypothetical protein